MANLEHWQYCAERAAHYYMLQFERRAMGWYGSALFYQDQAARWHIRAMAARNRYLIDTDLLLNATLKAIAKLQQPIQAPDASLTEHFREFFNDWQPGPTPGFRYKPTIINRR